MEYQIIAFLRLHLVNALPRFVEPLQGQGEVGQIGVSNWIIRCESQGLPGDLRSFFILPLLAAYAAQIVVRSGIPWVALHGLLIRLGRFIQFPGDIRIVEGGDAKLFPFAGMLPQLECLGVVLAGPP